MNKERLVEDRALLTVMAWRHDKELVGIVRWRPSVEEGAETVTSVHGFGELVARVLQELQALSTDED
jgi:hypothetical protein